MKKILMMLCIMFSVLGCSCSKDDRITISKGELPTVNESSSHLYGEFSLLSYELETAEYDGKIANKDSFLLFVYREGCYGCGLLAPALKSYVDENNVSIYTLEISKITNHSLYTEEEINATPYLVLIDEGNIVKKEIVTLTNNASTNNEWVENWMDENIIWEE